MMYAKENTFWQNNNAGNCMNKKCLRLLNQSYLALIQEYTCLNKTCTVYFKTYLIIYPQTN